MSDAENGASSLGRRVGGALGSALGRVFHQVGNAGNLIGEVFRLPTKMEPSGHYAGPGEAPGIEHDPRVLIPPTRGQIRIICMDFNTERLEERQFDRAEALSDHEQPSWATVRWIRVEGLHPHTVDQLRQQVDFHTLAAEDVLHPPQRPRVDAYGDHLFIVTQLISATSKGLSSQQISMFVRPNLLVSFQEYADSIWDPLHTRLSRQSSRLRSHDASYLAYAMLDSIVDHSFPVLDRYSQHLEQLEDVVLESQSRKVLEELHAVRRELALLRRVLWPTREMLIELRREGQVVVSDTARAYLADVNDHCVQLLDMVDTFRDLSTNLTDLHLSLSSYRMNEVMQVLTVISTIFIPITFVAGVFGMNFKFMPELSSPYGYPAFWIFCVAQTLGLLWVFRRKGWLG